MRDKIRERFHPHALSFEALEEKSGSGIFALNPFHDPSGVKNREKSSRLVAELREQYGFRVKHMDVQLPEDQGLAFPILISTPIWVSPGGIDDLISAIEKLASELA